MKLQNANIFMVTQVNTYERLKEVLFHKMNWTVQLILLHEFDCLFATMSNI